VARRLMKTNPRLTQDKADWLAQHCRPPSTAGRRRQRAGTILGDAAHKIINANIFRVDETLALYARISAPTLMIEASDDSLQGWWKNRYTLDEFHERLKSVPSVRVEQVADAGHMLHHDQPQRVAQLIGQFLAG
jgi:pimeloyl-ACP methyl ester carboxylesterase